MKTRIISIILCFGLIIGFVSGCGAKEDETSAITTTEEISEKENDSKGDSGNSDSVEDSSLETDDEVTQGNPHEVVNALGMSLIEGTTLLVTVTKYRFSDKHQYITEQYEFDSEGRILRHLEQGVLGYENTEYEFEYDSSGNLARKNCYKADFGEKNWELSYWIEYSYVKDETGRHIGRTERIYNADGCLSGESVYDSENRMLEETHYVENVLREYYEFDSLNNQSLRTIYDKQGDFEVQHRTVYDDAGNLILEADYDVEGNVVLFEGYECDSYVCCYIYRRYENTYDEYGNLINQVYYDYENNEWWHSESTYDDQGNLINQLEYDAENSEIGHDEYMYDEENNLVWRFSSGEWNSEGTEWTYEYDDNGNCTKISSTWYSYDEEGVLTPHTSVDQEWKYDERNRLIQYLYSDYLYEYTYTVIGIPEKDYPFNKIKIQ